MSSDLVTKGLLHHTDSFGVVLGSSADRPASLTPVLHPGTRRPAAARATAPIEAPSANKTRHRLNPRGNRKLNHVLHVAAVSQLRYPGQGRDYYEHKVAEGKTSKEAIRALKRRISDVVYRRLLADA